MRSFFSFLRLNNLTTKDLSTGIPAICVPTQDYLTDYLSVPELERLLSVPTCPRNSAILIFFATLGLRTSELAQLRLDDIDWRAGVLTLSKTKHRRQRILPLPQRAGKALARYIQKDRPQGPCRHVFLSLEPPGHPLSTSTFSGVVASCLKQANIPSLRKGAHLLRHTVASHLLQNGASLKEVADLLGHQNLSTTMIYAKVNLPMLSHAIQPWPGQEVAS